MLDEYLKKIDLFLKSPLISTIELSKDKRSEHIAIIIGKIIFIDRSELYFMEYIESNNKITKKTYRYHYQDKNNKMIFRYDNAPHYPHISTFPHHKHFKSKIFVSSEPTLKNIINEIKELILSK